MANMKRMKDGHHFLQIPVTPYEQDKPNICAMRKNARKDFSFFKDRFAEHVADMDSEETKERVAEEIRRSQLTPEQRKHQAHALGEWFADYLVDAGYQVDDSPWMFKQMMMAAFPRVARCGDTEITAENVEEISLNHMRLFNRFFEEEKEDGSKLVGHPLCGPYY